MKKIYVIHSTALDFQKELYEKLEKISGFEFIFPHRKENENIDSRERINNCDLVLAEVSFPSTGSGIELGRAECYGKPILAIYRKNSKISSALNFVTNNFMEYENLENDFEKLEKVISDIILK